MSIPHKGFKESLRVFGMMGQPNEYIPMKPSDARLIHGLWEERDMALSRLKKAEENLAAMRKKYLRAAELAVMLYPYAGPPIPTESPTDMDYEMDKLESDVDEAKKLRET